MEQDGKHMAAASPGPWRSTPFRWLETLYTFAQPAAAPERISCCLGCGLPAAFGGWGWEARCVARLPHTLFLNHRIPAAAHQCRCCKVSVVMQAGQHLRKGEGVGRTCRCEWRRRQEAAAAGGGGGGRRTSFCTTTECFDHLCAPSVTGERASAGRSRRARPLGRRRALAWLQAARCLTATSSACSCRCCKPSGPRHGRSCRFQGFRCRQRASRATIAVESDGMRAAMPSVTIRRASPPQHTPASLCRRATTRVHRPGQRSAPPPTKSLSFI